MEEKLPAAPWFDLPTANSRCDSLKHRLRLSEADLQTVVMARPAVLGLSYEGTVAVNTSSFCNSKRLRHSCYCRHTNKVID